MKRLLLIGSCLIVSLVGVTRPVQARNESPCNSYLQVQLQDGGGTCAEWGSDAMCNIIATEHYSCCWGIGNSDDNPECGDFGTLSWADCQFGPLC